MNSPSFPIAGVFGLGGMELILILAIVMLLFGAKKLPDLAKGLGKSIKEFKKASNENSDDDDTAEKKPAAKKESVKSNDSN
ncbi:MAG: twin-arginine translocase TatA/TatE family subunit [Opitutaceae bacterium]|jgi:sec-independent protein translocase protein TatA